MRKVFRWIGIVSGALLGVAAVAMVALYFMAEARLTKTYAIVPETVPIPAHVDATKRDWPLMLISFCEGCHGKSLDGALMVDDNIGRLAASNLTSGKGGVGSRYTDEDWVRALRHGVRPDGRPLVGMPSDTWTNLNDQDLGQIIAYVKGVPPVDHELPPTQVRIVGRVMLGIGLFPPEIIPAEVIDHDAPRLPAPEPGPTAEYGLYLSRVCTVCHGPSLAGGLAEGEGRNLTPAGDLATWSEADFLTVMRTGVTPQGEQLRADLFPYKDLGQLTDDQLKAIWLYLKSLPPVESKQK